MKDGTRVFRNFQGPFSSKPYMGIERDIVTHEGQAGRIIIKGKKIFLSILTQNMIHL